MANNAKLDQIQELEWLITPIQNTILKTLDAKGPLTRRDLVKFLGTARTTIYDNLLKLQKEKLVEKFTRNDGNRGRPLVFWKIS